MLRADSVNKLRTGDILEAYPDARVLSHGGQKVVYAIEHPQYGSAVLKLGTSLSSRGFERISREVDTLSQLESDWYPRLFEFRQLDDQRFLIIEERIHGETLANSGSSFYSPTSATALAFNIATGLQELWSKDIIHRDIKPQNIMITRDGRPRIIDLGIARLLSLDSLTLTGAPWGPCTPNYASPEQLENRKHDINHRSDQFSLGIVFAQLLLSGRHPFDPRLVGSGETIPENILTGRWLRAEFCQGPLQFAQPLLERMLGRQPFERYRRPDDLLNALAEAKTQ